MIATVTTGKLRKEKGGMGEVRAAADGGG